jgi:hypothetical protein
MRNFSQLLKEEYVAPAEAPKVAAEREAAGHIATVLSSNISVNFDAKRLADGIVAIGDELTTLIDSNEIRHADILNIVKNNHQLFELDPEATTQIIVKYIHKIYFELHMMQVEMGR